MNDIFKLLFVFTITFYSTESFSQKSYTDSVAYDLYNQGLEEFEINGNFQISINKLKEAYDLLPHSEIAYAISYVCFFGKKHDDMRKYAKLAVSGNPKLSKEMEDYAWKLIEWKEPKGSGLYADLEDSKGLNPKNPSKILSKQQIENFELNGYYIIQQTSTGRYLDAYEDSKKDWDVVSRKRMLSFNYVTRETGVNWKQVWVIRPAKNNAFTIQQRSSSRYMDAHEYDEKDWSVVTRPRQLNNTQLWVIKRLGENTYSIQQKSSGRYLDAHDSSDWDFSVVTRPFQNNTTQVWLIKSF